jgi:hypothetical protein
MTDFEKLLASGYGLFLLGPWAISTGIAMVKCKPVVITHKNFRNVIPFTFLTFAILDVFWLIEEVGTSNPDIPYVNLLLFFLVFIVVLCVLWMLFIPKMFALYNVTETMVISSLGEALQEHEIKYVSQESTRAINRILQQSQIVVSLPELGSSIKVTLTPVGTAWLKFSGWRRSSDYEETAKDFVNALSIHKCCDSTMIGMQLLLVGFGVTGMVLYSLIKSALL